MSHNLKVEHNMSVSTVSQLFLRSWVSNPVQLQMNNTAIIFILTLIFN
jgi:hypothetical protein